jgi:hypothetical protein
MVFAAAAVGAEEEEGTLVAGDKVGLLVVAAEGVTVLVAASPTGN